MKKITVIFMVVIFSAYWPSAGKAQEVGEIAPDFNLVDDSGKEIKLGDFKGGKNIVLIFYAEHK